MKMKTALRLSLLTLSIGLTACQRNEPVAPPATTPADAPAETTTPNAANLLTLTAESARYAGLETLAAVETELVTPIESTGRVALNEDRTIRVGAFIDGRVMKVMVKVGDRVREGQTLAEIHTHDVHEAGANLVQARANLTQKRNQAAFARTTLERAERLYQSKALSKQELERARVENDSAGQDVIHAGAELERAKGHLELLGLDPETLNYDAPVLIKAPGSGVIMQRDITTGAGITPGAPLFTISDLSQVWVVAEVEEKRLPLLRVGMPITVNVAAYPEEGFRGSIAKISDLLNPQTRMIEVRCLVDNRSGKLKPEMYALTKIAAGEKTRALVIPRAALQDVDGQEVVFVAREAQQFEKRNVRTGRQEGELVEILEGLKPGEKVVTAGGFLLKSELLKSRMEEE